MRFFKAFGVLHRRTKSETFIPVPPISNLNPRPLSLPADLGSNSDIFDFATSNFAPISANFSHLRGTNDAVNASPHPRSARDSLNTLVLVEENMRLREALNLWFSEYSKADDLFQKCRADLAFERDKVRTLQQQAARDRDLIGDLKKDLSRYEKRFENLGDSSASNARDRHPTPLNSPLLSPGSSDSAASLVISKKIRTLDEYTSALRMTLSTRRQLRDQKKLSKFWKNLALSTGEHQDIITPSTSAISSVYDPLPPERKRAIDVLMRERGWPYPRTQPGEPKIQVDNADASEPPIKSSLSGDLSRIHPASSIAATLVSTSSNNSVSSRLAPLASESLKAEINLFFGIQRSEKPASPPANILSSTASKTMGESPSRLSNIVKAKNLTFSFGSYGDLSQRHSDHAPQVKLPVSKENPMRNSESSTGTQSSRLAESSVPSGSSRIFGEALALLHGQHDTDMYSDFLRADINREEMVKPLTSGRSLQKYLAPPAKQIPSKPVMSKKRAFLGKENAVLPLSVMKKPSKISKIQNPLFAKD